MLQKSPLHKKFHWIYFVLSLFILTLSLWLTPGHAATADAAQEVSPVEEFIRSHCDHDEASACLDLGILRDEQGKKSDAKLAYAKACKLGAKLACQQKN